MSKSLITCLLIMFLFLIKKPALGLDSGYFGETTKSIFSTNSDKKKGSRFSVNKYGTLIGIQRGRFFNIELGIEQQKKQLKIRKPNTIAWLFNMEYAWEPNTLGFKLGGWFKTGRMGFTYGANLIGTSNFDRFNMGITPSLGFKLVGFHVMASYNQFFSKPEYDYNTMHISIRYFISRRRKFVKNN